MPKNAQTTSQLHSSHRLVKYCSKFSKPGFQQNVNRELPDVQAGFRKGRGTRDQIANICWITKKAREFQKSIYFCSERSRLVSGPGMKSSPPEAKNPSVFSRFSNNLSLGSKITMDGECSHEIKRRLLPVKGCC